MADSQPLFEPHAADHGDDDASSTGVSRRPEVCDRKSFVALLDRLRGGDESAQPATLVLIDIDDFGRINEDHGVAAGDRVLEEVQRRLAQSVNGACSLARIGDDEFAILERSPTDDANRGLLSEMLSALLQKPFSIDSVEIRLSWSIGQAQLTAGQGGLDLLSAASASLRTAKRGRRKHAASAEHTGEGDSSAFKIEDELIRAVESDQIEPFFQPVVDLATRKNTGFEMFARWNHAERGMIPPGEFLAAAERLDLMPQLMGKLLRRACHFAATWPSRFTLAVNVSLSQLRDPELPALFRSVLEDTGLEAARLEIDIPEAAATSSSKLAPRIAALAALGVRIVLDDFGNSFSSLRNLRKLPIDKLKIDRTFVSGSTDGAEGLEVLRGLVALSKNLSIPIVAEGVENEATAQVVELAGCSMAQGWYFAKPMPAPKSPLKRA